MFPRQGPPLYWILFMLFVKFIQTLIYNRRKKKKDKNSRDGY